MINTFNSEAEVNELMAHIHATTNFPTFEQFRKNPEQWRKNEEDIFESLSMMEAFFKKRIKNVTYLWHGKYKCKTLEQLQNRSRGEGYKGTDLEYQPRVKPTYGTSNLHDSSVDVQVDVYSKTEVKLMGGIATDE